MSRTSPGSLRSSDAYLELRRRLLLGEYPAAERLAELRLAADLGVSRTPIREALLRLEAEGLLERRQEGGFFARVPDLHAVRDLYELRRTLELEGIYRPGRHGTRHDHARLRIISERWQQLATDPPEPDPGFVEIDERFHLSLIETCGNNAMSEHLQIVNSRIRIVRMHNFVHTHRIRETAEQHLAILDALLNGAPNLAAQRLDAHLAEAMEQAVERAARRAERMRFPDEQRALARDETPPQVSQFSISDIPQSTT